MNVVHHEDQRALVRRRLDGLEKRAGEPQRDDLGRPLDGLGHSRKDIEELGRHARQLAQRLGLGPADRPLERELLDQLGEDRERQFPLGVVCLGARHHGALHLTRRHEGIGERRLADPRVAREHDDPRHPAPHFEPRVVQLRERLLAAD